MSKTAAFTLLLFLFYVPVNAQTPDTLVTDSIIQASSDQGVSTIFAKSKFLNIRSAPVSMINVEKNQPGKELLFYLLSSIVLFFGFLKVFYAKYFNNLFRLYFNTSLRQNQLTDLILQAKLSSLIFNIFFFINTGLYLYFLLSWFGLIPHVNPLLGMSLSIILVASVYLLKYFGLLFIGWLAGMQETADIYIFITFLSNKIIGICLLPFLFVIAFSEPQLVQAAVIVSLALTILLIASRYLRSFGLLEKNLKVSLVHFVIYILSMEVIPLLLIYKGLFIGLKYIV